MVNKVYILHCTLSPSRNNCYVLLALRGCFKSPYRHDQRVFSPGVSLLLLQIGPLFVRKSTSFGTKTPLAPLQEVLKQPLYIVQMLVSEKNPTCFTIFQLLAYIVPNKGSRKIAARENGNAFLREP